MAVPHTPADVYRGRQRCGPWTVMHARRAVMHVRRVRSSLSGVEGLGGVIEFGWVLFSGYGIRSPQLPEPTCMPSRGSGW